MLFKAICELSWVSRAGPRDAETGHRVDGQAEAEAVRFTAFALQGDAP